MEINFSAQKIRLIVKQFSNKLYQFISLTKYLE